MIDDGLRKYLSEVLELEVQISETRRSIAELHERSTALKADLGRLTQQREATKAPDRLIFDDGDYLVDHVGTGTQYIIKLKENVAEISKPKTLKL
jgi:hypothetical protein